MQFGGQTGSVELKDVWEPIQHQLFGQAGNIASHGLYTGDTVYPGRVTPEFQPMELEAFNQASQLSQGLDLGQVGQNINQLSTTGGIDPTQMQGLYDSQRAQMMRDIGGAGEIVSGQYAAHGLERSGMLQKALADAAGRASLDLNTNIMGMKRDDMLTGARNQLGGSALAAQLAPTAMGGLQAGGATQRGVLGSMGAEDVTKWAMAKPYNSGFLNMLPMMLGAQPNVPVATQSGFSVGVG